MTKPNPVRVCASCGKTFRKAYRHETYCSVECLLWSRIDKRGADECWPWIGSKQASSYGDYRFKGRLFRAHRVVCELTHGAPPTKRAHAMHSCDNPSCCNPAHISWGSADDNMRDMRKKGRWRIVRPQRGEERHNAMMTEDSVGSLRKDVAAGMSTYSAAKKYGISQPTAVQIKNRITWKHVK